MDLRTKLLLGIGLAFVLAFTLVAVFSVISMQASYRSLEDYEVRHAVTTTQNAMETDMKNSYSTVRDYSAWTETYRFAQGENPGWVAENMGTDFFSRFALDRVLVFDRAGRLIFSMQYNTSSREVEPVPDTLVTEIRNFSEAQGIISSENGSYGILDTSSGPLLIASHPILTDTYRAGGGKRPPRPQARRQLSCRALRAAGLCHHCPFLPGTAGQRLVRRCRIPIRVRESCGNPGG